MLKGLSSCTNLKWLSVIENKLVSLKGVEVLSNLQARYCPNPSFSFTVNPALNLSSPVGL
jgi:Leucine-rich repeat (LRR) protein